MASKSKTVVKSASKTKPAAVQAPETAAKPAGGRDAWGARIGSATAPFNTAIAALADSDKGAGANEMYAKAHALAAAAKIQLRGALGTHLNALRLAGYVEPVTRGVWRVTKIGSTRWNSKAPGASITEVVNGGGAEKFYSDSKPAKKPAKK
jgi:hypothetical protein